MSERQKTVAIFDGNHTAFRANCVFQLSDSKGRRTSVMYGVLDMISAFIRNHLTDALVIVWDYGSSHNRKKILPTYKENRKPKTEEERQGRENFFQQINEVKRVLDALGIPQIQLEGYEGDDMLCAITELASSINYSSVVVTSDKDMLQLVGTNVDWYDPIKKNTVNSQNFYEKIGLEREDFLLYKCLMGDSGDDIPGIRGIGEVRAKKLLQKYHSINALCDNTDLDIAGKLVRGQHEILLRNMKLVDLKQFINSEVLEKVKTLLIKNREIDEISLEEILTDYEFHSILSEFRDTLILFSDQLSRNNHFISKLENDR